ncbi:hypothetical protein HPB50_022072 [Hyalomma asiaticum]|uniref:Uncharacterized protein n=1 Tax=Hyalomma asiaticum TaxID=266040 RepID=A0ACB7TP06_HYAAI|nr:hypothetical protein HPB50_022072 [Hyalomma asiaticum]
MDYLCNPCFRYFSNEVSSSNVQLSDNISMLPEEEIDVINQTIVTTGVSPLKPPGAVRSWDRPAYLKRKQREVQEAVSGNVRCKIRQVYNQGDASGSSACGKCSLCAQWTESFPQAYAASMTPQERCEHLSPAVNTSKKCIPEASMYQINKSRKLKVNYGVWYRLDPFTRQKAWYPS